MPSVNHAEIGDILQLLGEGKRAENFSLTTPTEDMGDTDHRCLVMQRLAIEPTNPCHQYPGTPVLP